MYKKHYSQFVSFLLFFHSEYMSNVFSHMNESIQTFVFIYPALCKYQSLLHKFSNIARINFTVINIALSNNELKIKLL